MLAPLRVPSRAGLFAACLAALLSACGSGDPGVPTCQFNRDCKAGEACVQGVCKAVPCGGCEADQVCVEATSTCVPAQGAPCPAAGCPTGYQCNGTTCSKVCVLNRDCDAGTVCSAGKCVQCFDDGPCASVAGKPHCDALAGNCVECTTPIHCSALGTGHFCDTASHTCKAGCKVDGDCNLSNGEKCDTSAGTPGKCIECKSDTDCSLTAPACDATGHCVMCTADKYCGPGTPRCQTSTKTCVVCLPENDPTASDCSINTDGHVDTHTAMTCDPGPKTCVPGCKVDNQCGCPRDSSGNEKNCPRKWVQEHCDPLRTTMDGVAGPTIGACVECTANAHCSCLVAGTANTGACKDNPKLGSLNGSRCVNDTCVAGCDADADCPANKLCSLAGPTAHTCVECSCLNKTIRDAEGVSGGWCDDPAASGKIGGCGVTSQGAQRVCDGLSLKCRLKRQNEGCTTSTECGDPQDPKVPADCRGLALCVYSWHGTTGGQQYCAAGKNSGRCGTACDDLNTAFCSQGTSAVCGNNAACRASTGEDTSHSGAYCVPQTGAFACTNP